MGLGFSGIGAVLLGVVVLAILAWPTRYHPAKMRRPRRVQVLVLGDVGRSPRMQYHALSIARRRGHVQLIGYYDTPLIDALELAALRGRVRKVPLAPPPPALTTLPFVLGGPLKVLWQAGDLFLTLAYTTTPARWLVVQNPPSIPVLAVAGVTSWMRGTRLLVDWHNYGWSILAGTRGARHPFVAVARIYEALLGRWAGHAHLAVTAAMAKELEQPPYRLTKPSGPAQVTMTGAVVPSATPTTLAVLHDRPAELFQMLTPAFLPSAARLDALRDILTDDVPAAVTALLDNTAANTAGNTAGNTATRVLVSSTSWTPDEDFQILLDALVAYVARTPFGVQRPPVLAVITGKGPQKQVYLDKLAALAASGALPPAEIAVHTAFLPMRDYARLLANADLGVCLHMSSSGVDLPMKVVDMFGAGLPVAAYSAYASFGELVRDGDNGRGFVTADDLAALLASLLGGDTAELDRLRAGARKESSLRWDDEWGSVVAPVLGLPQVAELAQA